MTDDFAAFNEFERSVWEQRAAAYAGAFGRLTSFTIEPLLDVARVHSGSAVLDVGTGPGFVAAAAAARGAEVTGIDVAAAMVAIAQRNVPAGRFQRGSAEALPLPDHAFDAVVGNFVLLHLGYPDRGVAEALRVLRPGGRGAFTLWQPPAANPVMGVFHQAVDAAGVAPPADVPTGPPMFANGNADSFAALLRAAGFDAVTVVACTGLVRVVPSEWWDAVLRSTPRTGSLISRQTPAVQREIRERYDELVAPYADGAEAVLPAAALLASGTAPTS